MKKMKLPPTGDKPVKYVQAKATRTSEMVQPADPRLANRYNPTIRKNVTPQYIPVTNPSPPVEMPPTPPNMIQDGFYTTDDNGNRVYDQNKYFSGSSKAKLIQKIPNPVIQQPQFKKGVKKMNVKGKSC